MRSLLCSALLASFLLTDRQRTPGLQAPRPPRYKYLLRPAALPAHPATMDHPSTIYLANSGRRPSSRNNDTALRPNDADLTHHHHHHDISHHHHITSSRTSSHLTSPPQTDDDEVETSSGLDIQELKEQNCDRRRPEEDDHSRLDRMSADLVGKTVTPFLREHVPGLYAPVSKIDSSEKDESKTPSVDTNSRYCYRHRPDSKCRRAADESKMAKIQSVRCTYCSLPASWLADPSRYRNLTNCRLLTNKPSQPYGVSSQQLRQSIES